LSFIDDILYKINRKLIIDDVIPKIGNIEEYDDKFICRANQKDVNKNLEDGIYKLGFRSFSSWDYDTNGKVCYYKLDKPIYYIFENIVFDDFLDFYSNMNTYVVFKNCTFNHGVRIKWADDVTFSDNTYCDTFPRYIFGGTFLFSDSNVINKLRFINDNFINSTLNHPVKFGIDIDVNSLEIINTNIEIFNKYFYCDKEVFSNKGVLNIKANLVKLINSNLNVFELYLDSKSIIIDDDSRIVASGGMIIENDNEDLKTNNIDTPYLVYNGVELFDGVIDKNSIDLKKDRLFFIDTLKKVRDKAIDNNEKLLSEIKNNVSNRPLKKVLKKQ